MTEIFMVSKGITDIQMDGNITKNYIADGWGVKIW